MNQQRKKRSVEIEHPHIREIDERTLHPGVDVERKQDLQQKHSEDQSYEANQAQG